MLHLPWNPSNIFSCVLQLLYVSIERLVTSSIGSEAFNITKFPFLLAFVDSSGIYPIKLETKDNQPSPIGQIPSPI